MEGSCDIVLFGSALEVRCPVETRATSRFRITNYHSNSPPVSYISSLYIGTTQKPSATNYSTVPAKSAFYSYSPPLPHLSLDLLLRNNSNNILVSYYMAQPHPLRDMPRARAPHQRILEALLQRTMHLVTHVLDGAVLSHDQGFAEVGLHALPLRVYPHEVQLLPGAVDDIADAEVELAGHDDRVVFVRELVEELHRDAVDFVVDVETGEGLVFGCGRERGEGGGGGNHLMYLRWAAMITSIKSSTVASKISSYHMYFPRKGEGVPFSSRTRTSQFSIL